ncbi:TIGR00282 family metallophosphoesterase [Desmospora profundinema]|uniref:Metallophosphoesterase (TIGR00282 family) n=1 Tax=Desmospora profundinema TaxID=1571184 RepID=A0ABU1IHL7_9BACL|nr:TIGR00282 family metallophosphoesterase [Desmospora profundinema]MDR6224263.1 metallophosphoesterase (TIGR00282 family) [Desmospora profundinema]
MRVLMFGDVVGRPGREALLFYLPRLKRSFHPDAIVVNGENAADGRGITRPIVREFLNAGLDGITLGNHTWDKKEIFDFIDQEERVIRPANFPEGTPGLGMTRLPLNQGRELVLINLMGRSFLSTLDCPFRRVDALLSGVKAGTPVLVDFHAETTSEKQAMAWHLDGRVSAVIGTHTHVQTGDERILPGGTATLTDVGMVGPRDAVLGMDKDLVLKRFWTQLPVRFEVAQGPNQVNAVLIDIDDKTGQAQSIRRIRIDDDNPWFD